MVLALESPGCPRIEHDIAFDRAIFRLQPCHHGFRLKLADRPAILHHHGVERAVDQHGVVADDLHAAFVGRGDHAAGGAGIDRLQHDRLRPARQHVFERRQLRLFVVVGGIEDHLGAERLGLGEEGRLVALIALLLHGLQEEADFDLVGGGGRPDESGKRNGERGETAQDGSAVKFHGCFSPVRPISLGPFALVRQAVW